MKALTNKAIHRKNKCDNFLFSALKKRPTMMLYSRLPTAMAFSIFLAAMPTFAAASFLHKTENAGLFATGLTFHPVTNEYIIAGTGYDTDASNQQAQDSCCAVIIGHPDNETDALLSTNEHQISEPQVCMGGVLAVPGTGARVAHVMGTKLSETHQNPSTEPIDTILQPLFYNHDKNTVESNNPFSLPQYTYPVASTTGYGVSIFVALHEVLNGHSQFAEKLLYSHPAPTASKKEKLQAFTKFTNDLTDPKHIQSRPKSTATRSPRTPQIMHIVDPLEASSSEKNRKSYTIELRTDNPTGAATISAMKFHKGKNWLIVGGSVHGTGSSFGNTTLDGVQGDANSWDGFISFFHGDTGELINNVSQAKLFRIHSGGNQDDFLHDICLDDGDGLYVVGTAETGAFIHKYSLGSQKLLWSEQIKGGETIKDIHCTIAPQKDTLYVGGETREDLEDGSVLPTTNAFVRSFEAGSGSLVWSKQLDTSTLYKENRHDHLAKLEVNPSKPDVVVALVNSIHLASGTSDVVFFDLSKQSGASLLDQHQEPPKEFPIEMPGTNMDSADVAVNIDTETGGADHRAIILLACLVPMAFFLALAACYWFMNKPPSLISCDGSLKQGSVTTMGSSSDPQLNDDDEEGFFDECKPPPTDSFQYFHDGVKEENEPVHEDGRLVDVEIQ